MLLMPFQHSHCTLVTILFRPFARRFMNLAMRIRALFPKSASILGLVEPAFWRMPFFTEWIGASSFDVILARQSSHSPLGLLSLRLLVIDAFFPFCRVEDLGEGFGCVVFARLLISWRKLQFSPFEHCLLAFHCQQSPRLLCLRCFVPDSWQRRLFQNFHFWSQNSYFEFLARYFFSPLSAICDNQVQLSSDESPYCTIPIRSWVSQTLVFFCTSFPRCHQMGFSSLILKNFVPFWIEFLNIIISKNNCK